MTSIATRIRAVNNASVAQFPWMARLKISGSKHCGAAIVVDNSGQLYSFFLLQNREKKHKIYVF